MNRLAYRPDIQGLRALAVLAVILFHYGGTLLPGGFVGVDVFLVISGYLITQQIQFRKGAIQGTLTSFLGRFYLGRIRRIVPAYFFMLATVTILAKLLFTNSDFTYFVASLKSAVLFFSNSYFANFGDYFAPTTAEQPLLHTWSLAVEMQFYMLLPIALLLIPDRYIKQSILFISMVLILVAEWQLRVMDHRQVTYYALYSRVPEFLAGAYLAISSIGLRWSTTVANIAFWAGASLIVGSLIVLDGASLFPGLLSLPAVVGAGLIISASRSSFSAFLCSPLMVWTGFLSYSLYLWHWPVLALIRYYTGAVSLGLQETLVFIIATLLLACVSFYFVEEPARKLRLSFMTWRRLAAVLVITGVGSFGAYGVAIAAKAYFSSSGLPIEYTRYADPYLICHGVDNGHCEKGDLASSRKVLVIGDSHAAMLNGFFDRLGRDEGFKATVLTASSCVPISGFNVSKLPEWARQSCLDQISRVEALVTKFDMVFIAGMWSYQIEDPLFAPSLERFLQNQGSGRRVYVLSQVPELSRNPMRMYRFAGLGLPHQVSFNGAYQQANLIIAGTAKRAGASFIELDRLQVFRSAPYLDGQLIYMDESHLNQVGVDAYVNDARARIRELVIANER
ncbi:acyltransferase [Pusillimonas sp. T2]|uniref:acyltransferase family protein n=1 Tax=Pusillimonas sp. T2 TaxID=1548123 RepID=UPI000B9465E0|nr:acyltransferase family protein [Pusillimonas sp. T2]OXR48704.1 acyltransferase [Pusillimonas sp. T2]